MEKKQKIASDSLDEFVGKMLEEKGLAGEDKAVFVQLKEDLAGDLEERINAAILGALPADKMAQFEKLLDGEKAKEIQEFLAKNIPNLNEITALEMLNFRKTYLSTI